MGHYEGLGSTSLHKKLMEDKMYYLLEQISDELETERTNKELEFILKVLQNSKEYMKVLESLKPFLK